jgi:hypothetical protein
MYDIINTGATLLEAATAKEQITSFLTGGIGQILALVLSGVGFIVIVVALFKAIKDVLGGKIGGAVKTILGGALLAAFLLFPATMLGGLIDTVQNLFNTFTKETTSVVDNQKWGGTTTP